MVRLAKVNTIFKVIQYTGNNWDEIDEFVGKKGVHDVCANTLTYIIPFPECNGFEKYVLTEGWYILRPEAEILSSEAEISMLSEEDFNQFFSLLPLEIEEKIKSDFDAKEEM